MILESYMNNNIDFMLRESNELLQENKFTEGIKKGWNKFIEVAKKIFNTIKQKILSIIKKIKNNKNIKEGIKNNTVIIDYDYKQDVVKKIKELCDMKPLNDEFKKIKSELENKEIPINEINFGSYTDYEDLVMKYVEIKFDNFINSKEKIKINVKDKEGIYNGFMEIISQMDKFIESINFMIRDINGIPKMIQFDFLEPNMAKKRAEEVSPIIKKMVNITLKAYNNVVIIVNKINESLDLFNKNNIENSDIFKEKMPDGKPKYYSNAEIEKDINKNDVKKLRFDIVKQISSNYYKIIKNGIFDAAIRYIKYKGIDIMEDYDNEKLYDDNFKDKDKAEKSLSDAFIDLQFNFSNERITDIKKIVSKIDKL